MWDLPGPGVEPVSPALAGGFLTTAPPGKPLFFFLCRSAFLTLSLPLSHPPSFLPSLPSFLRFSFSVSFFFFCFFLQRRKLQLSEVGEVDDVSNAAPWPYGRARNLVSKVSIHGLGDARLRPPELLSSTAFVGNWIASEKQWHLSATSSCPLHSTAITVCSTKFPQYMERSWRRWAQAQRVRRGWNVSVTHVFHVSPQSSTEWGDRENSDLQDGWTVSLVGLRFSPITLALSQPGPHSLCCWHQICRIQKGHR